jgi:hypothetical protein
MGAHALSYFVYKDLITYNYLVRDFCISFRSSQHLSPHTTYQTTDAVNNQPDLSNTVKSQPSLAKIRLYKLE